MEGKTRDLALFNMALDSNSGAGSGKTQSSDVDMAVLFRAEQRCYNRKLVAPSNVR